MYFCHRTVIITLDNIPGNQYGAKPFYFSMMTYLSIQIIFNQIQMKF